MKNTLPWHPSSEKQGEVKWHRSLKVALLQNQELETCSPVSPGVIQHWVRIWESQKSLGWKAPLDFIWFNLLLKAGPWIRLFNALVRWVLTVSSKESYDFGLLCWILFIVSNFSLCLKLVCSVAAQGELLLLLVVFSVHPCEETSCPFVC